MCINHEWLIENECVIGQITELKGDWSRGLTPVNYGKVNSGKYIPL